MKGYVVNVDNVSDANDTEPRAVASGIRTQPASAMFRKLLHKLSP